VVYQQEAAKHPYHGELMIGPPAAAVAAAH